MSLSREFAAFVAALKYADLPAEVVDRAKGVTLEALTSALVARDMPASRQALALMQEEEAGGGGVATVLCHGSRLTKAGAAFVNAEMILAGGKWDTFRMLTHPGTAILPAALVAAGTHRRHPARSSSPPSPSPMRSWSGWPPSSSRRSCRAASTRDRCSASSAQRSPPPNSGASTKTRSTAPSPSA